MTLPATTDFYEEGLRLSAVSRHVEAIESFERALARQPDDTRVLFALGNTARTLGLVGPAQQFFNRVLALEPGRVEALVNLANLLRAVGNFPAAGALLAPALVRNPESAELWLTLGSVYREMGATDRAITHYREALVRKPDYPAALGNLADILSDQGQTEEALLLYDRVVKREPKNAQARLNRGILHFLCGSLQDGWRDYEARLDIPGKAPRCAHNLPRWKGENLNRTRLLVTAEQGVGDQLMFASIVPELLAAARDSDGSLVLECEPRLVSLFARSFPDATVRPSAMQTIAGTPTAHYEWLSEVGAATAAIELGSLPRILRRGLSEFPSPNAYLMPDDNERRRWKEKFAKLGESPRIGICWRSGKRGGARNIQFARLEIWGNFLRELPGSIVCAQYDAAPDEIAKLEALCGKPIFVPEGLDQKNELDRTCAMLSALDAVVSAPTAVAWLASGAGVRTFKVLYDTSWTSFGEVYEPFAPSCICVMPENPGDWVGSFKRAGELIRALPSER
jgi:tetratricopeptide (TPR) repeat protein